MPGTLSILSDTFSRVYGATIEALTDVGHGAATMPKRPSCREARSGRAGGR